MVRRHSSWSLSDFIWLIPYDWLIITWSQKAHVGTRKSLERVYFRWLQTWYYQDSDELSNFYIDSVMSDHLKWNWSKFTRSKSKIHNCTHIINHVITDWTITCKATISIAAFKYSRTNIVETFIDILTFSSFLKIPINYFEINSHAEISFESKILRYWSCCTGPPLVQQKWKFGIFLLIYSLSYNCKHIHLQHCRILF